MTRGNIVQRGTGEKSVGAQRQGGTDPPKGWTEKEFHTEEVKTVT